MSHGGSTDRRALGESEARESSRFSRFSRFSLGAGGSGRIRENQNAILPDIKPCHARRLQQPRENRENNSQLYACAGATHGDRKYSIGNALPFSPDSPPERQAAIVWDAFERKQDIYDLACRLGLPPSDTVDRWRLAVLRITRSEVFIQAVPRDVRLGRDEWEQWKALEASPRKLLGLLRKLIYGVRIWD